MSRVISVIITVIAIIACNLQTEAQKASKSALAPFSASTLIERDGEYVVFSNRCQTNLKKAGFTLNYTRKVQLHDVDDEDEDILVNSIEKTYAKSGIIVRLYYMPASPDTPCCIEIDFPDYSSKNRFLNSLTRLGFTGSGDAYLAIPAGMCIQSEGNQVFIGYLL